MAISNSYVKLPEGTSTINHREIGVINHLHWGLLNIKVWRISLTKLDLNDDERTT